ncbi:MAG: tail fiber protein [Methylobacter sp.]|uniref:phage tail protein n=1 Tax=Methylobacter sp. TaxID=2051955 RepID=UPI00272F8C2E|nr:tail fiber protein [Methylobacter sp.]MDP1663584.1 tail fiber protein [Methylobacter sp.]
MSDYYVGEIRAMAGLVSGNAPQGWRKCDGSLLPVSQFQALFALLGTTYGGDGVNSFALPDLRSRLPMGNGQGVAGATQLTKRTLGEKGGTESVALTAATMPAHTHNLNTAGVDATSPTVASNVTFANVTGQNVTYLNATVTGGTATQVNPAPTTVGNAGAGLSHANIMPGMGLYYIIATNGSFPTQA